MAQHPFSPSWSSDRSALAQAGRDITAALVRRNALALDHDAGHHTVPVAGCVECTHSAVPSPTATRLGGPR